MKSYEEFKQALVENMKEKMGDAVEVTIHLVKKNNFTEEQISIRFPEDKITPSVSLDSLYEEYIESGELGTVAERLAGYLKMDTNEIKIPMLSVEEARENLCFQLVSKEKNEALLKDCPYLEIPDTDLVKILRWKCGENASFIVKHGIAETLGICEEEMFDMAQDNLVKEEFRFRKMQDVLAEMMGMDASVLPEMEHEMYILTNVSGEFGARLITLKRLLTRIRAELDTGFFILPSSTHEALIIPDDGTSSVEGLAAIVKEVNRTEVAPKDVLSDHVYYYDLYQYIHTVA